MKKSKDKKGFGDTIVGFVSVVILMIFLIYVYLRTNSSTKYIVESFTLQTLIENGVEVTSYIQQSILSPALLYSTMQVIYFEALNGGITNQFLSDHGRDSAGFFNNVYMFVNKGGWKKEECLKYDSKYNTLYWSLAEGTKIAKTPVFDYFTDFEKKISTTPIVIKFKPPYQVGSTAIRKIGSVLISIYFLKDGQVTISSGGKALVVAKNTGVYVIPGDKIVNNEIKIVGSSENVAILKTVVSSPFSKDVVSDSTNMLKKLMENYLKALNGKEIFEYEVNVPDDFSVDFSPRANATNSSIWFKSGITIFHKYYGKSPLPSSITYGINMNTDAFTEKRTFVRYGLLVDYGIYFVKHLDDLVIPTIRKFMDKNMQDYYITWKVSGCCVPLTSCPSDETPTYPGTYIKNKVILPALKQLQQKLNSKSAKGITWNLKLIEFDTDFQVNTNKMYCRGRNHCIPYQSFNNFVMAENQKTYYHAYLCGCPYNPTTCYNHYCVVKYSHRYILKNLKILVTISDNHYQIFSPEKNKWVPLTLRFIVDINVDDNRCDNGKVAGSSPPSSSVVNNFKAIKICQNYGGKFGDLNTQVNPVNSITLPKTNKDVNP